MVTCPNCEWETVRLRRVNVEWRRDHSSENLTTGNVHNIRHGDVETVDVCNHCLDQIVEMFRDGWLIIR